jgi:hypothetical protein
MLPELMEKIYKDRTIYKKKMLGLLSKNMKRLQRSLGKEIARCNNIQMARRFNSILLMVPLVISILGIINYANAEAITLSGQVQFVGLKIK